MDIKNTYTSLRRVPMHLRHTTNKNAQVSLFFSFCVVSSFFFIEFEWTRQEIGCSAGQAVK